MILALPALDGHKELYLKVHYLKRRNEMIEQMKQKAKDEAQSE
jgi:hypothetical protein